MYETRDLLLQLMSAVPAWFWALVVWEAVWKLIALWKSAKNNHPVWFIIIAITSTLGIIPIIYLLWAHKSQEKRG